MPTAFEKRLATLAHAQFDKYRWLRENQEPLAGQVKAYWTDLGLAFPNVVQPWSAVFVSWCIKQAGATGAQFMFSPQDSQFVNAAIANAKAHATAVPEVGVDNKGNYLRTIGGNESDAVGMKEVRLDGNGLVKNAAGLYISVIETLL